MISVVGNESEVIKCLESIKSTSSQSSFQIVSSYFRSNCLLPQNHKSSFYLYQICNIFTQQYIMFYGTQRALDLCQSVPRIYGRMLIFTNVFRFVCHTQTQLHITTHQINFVQHISYSIFKQCRLHISHPSHLITTYIYLTLHMQIFNNLIEFRDFQDLI